MSAFIAKPYQQAVLDSLRCYFDLCAERGDADAAFYEATKRLWQVGQPYRPLAGFDPGMPYVCLRVPTGGGKTWLAASAVALANQSLLRTPHSVVLWLVPSEAIRTQTMKALADPAHPYRAALNSAGAVTVIGVDEALGLSRATLDTSTVVIVSTAQAFRREDTAGLRVYRANGALMHHFDGLDAARRAALLDEDGVATPSLANVLRLRRPLLVVDEAHNARTALTFDTFARFDPSGILELSATPDTTSATPSNVLHSVGAAELKAAEMIKLPVRLEAEPDWQRCLADAIARRNELQVLADAEHARGAPYLRPIVLVQAEPQRTGTDTLHVDAVHHELTTNHGIPPEHIARHAGDVRDLDDIDGRYPRGIADPACPLRIVITQKALAEGWDCPSAYILVSLANTQSGTAVEQLLGRVLRQPDARARATGELNQSYAFVRSGDFVSAAEGLRDRLVNGAGFNTVEASEFVSAVLPDQRRIDLGSGRVVMRPVVVALPTKPAVAGLDAGLKKKIEWSAGARTLTIKAPISATEEAQLRAAVQDPDAQAAVSQAATASRTTALEHFTTPAERGEILRVPQLALRLQGGLALFDDAEVLEYPWDLTAYPPHLTADQRRQLEGASRVASGGVIDVDGESGQVRVSFLRDLQRDLGLAYTPEHWTEARLARWLCQQLQDPAITHASKQAFVAVWLRHVLDLPGMTLARATQLKFTLRDILRETVRQLRAQAVATAYQQALFGPGHAARVIVDERHQYAFHPQGYAPARDYDAGKWGAFNFRGHYYGRIGEFDSAEEFACATHLDVLAQQGRIRHWVRNLVRREGASFFLQKADGRFYPDFLCELNDGTICAIEYKGAHGWTDAQDDRDIGALWAEMSNGRCRFVMVRDRDWTQIDALIA